MNAEKRGIKARYEESHRHGKFGQPGYIHGWIVGLLKPGKGGRLLDIGCAQGHLLKAAAGRGLDVYGVDISDAAVAETRKTVPGAEILAHDAERLPYPDGFFDYITNIGTLEHIVDPGACLDEMRRVLKDGGTACVMLPNAYYYGYVLAALRSGNGPTAHQPLERFAARAEWERLLKEHGFAVERMHKFNKFNKNRLLTFLRRFAIPLNFSHHFIFICGKGERAE